VEPTPVGRTFAFAGIGLPAPAVVWLVPDWVVLMLSSGATLGIGLALVYRPIFRSVPMLLLAAAAVGLLAAFAPAAMPLLIQMALPGCGLAVVARALRAMLERRSASRAPGKVELGAASSLTRTRPGISPLAESVISGGSSAVRSRSS